MSDNSSIEDFPSGQITSIIETTQEKEPKGNAGMLSTIFNLSNTIIGSGTLSIPLAFYYSGYLGGTLLLILAWALSAYGMHLLTYASVKTKLYTYKGISEEIGGKIIGKIVQICVFCYTTGTCIMYPIFLGGFFPHVFEVFAPGTILCDRHFCIMMVCFLVIFPLAIPKNLSGLKYASILALICIIYTAIAMFIQMFVTYQDNIETNPPTPIHFNIQMFRGFPFLTVSFCGHYNLLRFYGELKNRTMRKMDVIAVCSTLVAFVVYFTIGLSGYLSLNPNLDGGNVLVNYSTDDIPMYIACIGFCIVVSLSFPLVHHAQRDLFDKLVFPNWEESNTRRIILSLIIISFCMFAATAVEKISIVLAYNGSIFGALVVYIFPAYFGFKVGEGFTKYFSVFIMILGVCLSLIGVTITTLNEIGVFDE